MHKPSTASPRVSVITSHGRQELTIFESDRLIDVLKKNGVPWSAVSAYAVPSDGSAPRLAPSLDAKIGDFENTDEILLYFNRNVNPFIFATDDYTTVPSGDDGIEATEYLYQELNNESGDAELYLKKLNTEECKEVIAARVAETVTEHLPKGASLVVGVSGGGDSNALLHGLSKLEDVTIIPVILKGIPDWDAGVPRAQKLCEDYGLELTVMEEPEVRALLGVPVDDPVTLIDRFEREFAGDDFEFMGTLLIRLALSKKAKELGTEYICTGLNFEDVLCEAMFRVSSGMKPAPFPIRQIGDVSLIFPLWMCPKRIIDGCFPKFSRDNYDARYPCFSLGRNMYYSVVYSLQSQYPGYTDQLARGLSALSMADPVEYHLNEQLGFYTERAVPLPLVRRFQKMLGSRTTAARR